MDSLPAFVTPSTTQSVLILGAGPAGLSAATRLAHVGYRVTVVDHSLRLPKQPDDESSPPLSVLGCHRSTWALLESLGHPSHSPAFAEATLDFLLPGGRVAHYPRTRFPTPLRQLFTIGRFSGLSWKDRWTLLSWLEEIWEGSSTLPSDLENRTAHHWLESLHLDRRLIETIWNPLAHWLTGNDLQQLSADAFISSLKPFFISQASDSRIYVPRQPWQEIFVRPLVETLRKDGASLSLGLEAVQVEVQNERIAGVRCDDGGILRADWYIAAIPFYRLTPLLPERWLTRFAYFQQLTKLKSLSSTTIRVYMPAKLVTPRQILLSEGPFPWLLCTPSKNGQTMEAVVTLPQGRTGIDTEPQVCRLLSSLRLLQPNSPLTRFSQWNVDHAVLMLPPGTKTLRPIQLSPIDNLLVAGAWTDTGWPENLESAIVSGERCAEIIIQRHHP